MKNRNIVSVSSTARILCATLLFVLTLAFAPARLHAQLVADGGTLNLTTTTNFAPSNLVVGNVTGKTTLNVLAPGGAVRNQAGVIGNGSGSSFNKVTLDGANRSWTNLFTLHIGESGAANSLLVTNGGVAYSLNNLIMGVNVSSSSNLLAASSPGSVIEVHENLYIGWDGSGNTLRVNDGAMATTVFTTTLGTFSGSSNNALTISGTNARVLVGSEANIGYSGSQNSLVISNGGVLYNPSSGSLGYGAGSDLNQALVTGAGSVWSNGVNLFVGKDGANNTLTLQSGGRAVSAADTVVGNTASSTNNLLQVSGGVLEVGGALDVRRGTFRMDSGSVTAARIYATNGSAGVLQLNGGTLTTSGGSLNNGVSLGSAGYPPAVWVVRSNSTPTAVAADLRVGYIATNALLLITNGAVLTTGNSYLGGTPTANNNRAIVTGPGTLWNISGYFRVDYGTGNQLIVNNGAVLAPDPLLWGSLGTTNSLILITDPGSRCENRGFLSFYDVGGSLVISNGAFVANTEFACANGAKVVATGAGTVWTNSSYAWLYGPGDQLTLSDGATASSAGLKLGDFGGYDHNQMTITGSNTVWRSYGDVFIGSNSAFNSLVISNGGRVFNTNAYVGYIAQATNNQVLLSGAGSRWDMLPLGELYVGYGGSGNSLIVTNGAQVAPGYLAVGILPGANNNQVTVTGSGSSFATDTIDCGYGGSSNSLLIANGAQVQVDFGVNIGFQAGANGNQLIVTGPGSLLNIVSGFPSAIGVGGGNGNQLMISNGATVACNKFEFGGPSNTVLVTGTNSLWTAGELVSVNSGAGNQITIGDGGEFRCANLIVYSGSKLLLANGKATVTNVFALDGTLAGSGTIVTINNVLFSGGGSIISPGNPIGALVFSNSLTLGGTLLMDISKNGLALTNDELQVSGPLGYGGALTVTHLGPTALSAGDSFKLFTATSYSGAFSSMTLPALSSGLMWTNQLLVNGSLKVVAQTPPAISGVTNTGTNLVFNVTGGSPGGSYTLLTATNAALPLASWTTNSTGNFDWLGNVTLINAINPATPQRYFTVRSP